MSSMPKWFRPVSFVALLWNLLGCAAYLADVLMKPDDIAKLSAAQQAMYAARPAWSVGATALAVWGGALGCVGLILGKRWALPFLWVSLAGVVLQDISFFAMKDAAGAINPAALGLQGFVLIVAILLVFLARHAVKNSWLR